MAGRAYDLAELQRLDDRCRAAAAELGLDVPEIVFHLAPAERIYDIAARGLPGRYGHWRFGAGYERMKLDHDHGRSRIYELVLNTEPFQAYLLDGNAWVAQLLVIAHVYGHCWFFANNRYFQAVDRKFLHRVRAGADRIEHYARTHGRDRVEDFIDAVQAVAVHAPTETHLRRSGPTPPARPPVDPYGDLFPAETEAARAAHDRDVEAWRQRFPQEPDADLLGFVVRHAHRLQDWERDIVSILREEAAYFAPQRRTKIANEGFACWTHLQLVQQMQLPTDEFVAFAKLNAGVIQPHPLQVNPYSLGHALWCEIERLHDAPTPAERERYAGAGEIRGRDRVLELAATTDDASLVAAYLTPAVCEQTKLFAWRRERPDRAVLRITSREADQVRDRLLAELSTGGVPRLVVVDADAGRRGTLWVRHDDDGVGLDREYAVHTVPHLARLWGRTVVVESVQLVEQARQPRWFVCDPGETTARVLTTCPTG